MVPSCLRLLFPFVQAVKVDVNYTVSLVQAVGVSSGFLAQKNRGGKNLEELYSVEEFEYWNQDDFKGKIVADLRLLGLALSQK